MSRLDLGLLVHAKTMHMSLGATSRYEAIQELLDLLVGSHDLSLSKLGPAREALFRQERKHPSGTASGFAYPHALVDGLAAPVAAIGLSPDGVDFGGGPRAKVVVLALFPSGGAGHVTIPEVEEVLIQDRDAVASLASATSAEDLGKKIAELR